MRDARLCFTHFDSVAHVRNVSLRPARQASLFSFVFLRVRDIIRLYMTCIEKT